MFSLDANVTNAQRTGTNVYIGRSLKNINVNYNSTSCIYFSKQT